MNKAQIAVLLLVLLALTGVPWQAQAAALVQAETPTPTREPIKLVVSVYTSADPVAAGENFTLYVALYNGSRVEIQNLTVVFAPPPQLRILDTDNTYFVTSVWTGTTTTISKEFSCSANVEGAFPLTLTLTYNYQTGGQSETQTQTETITIYVAKPTPTPTSTPTPTFTPTITPTPTETPLPLEASANGAPSAVPSVTRPTGALLESAHAFTQTVTAANNISRELPAPATAPRPLVILSYAQALVALAPGQLFSATFTLSNVGFATAQAVVVTWEAVDILPVGSGPIWVLNVLEAGATEEIVARFLVTDQVPPGVHTIPVGVVFQDQAGHIFTWSAQVNLWVTAPPNQVSQPTVQPPLRREPTPAPVTELPWWMRLLLALVGVDSNP